MIGEYFYKVLQQMACITTVLPQVKWHVGVSKGEYILWNIFMLSTGMPV